MDFIPLAARVFLSVIFLRSGINKIFGFAGTQGFMASAGIPEGLTGFLLVGSIVLELLGALSVILGYKARWGAIALIVFLVPTTLIFHTNFAEDMQINQFLKNLGLIGGLLMVVYFGSGPLSVDGRKDLT
ncbi:MULTISPECIES: DoxX family protein [Chroococcaceae]|jgi:putative oxidoreductase|uniref:DoxX family protein n=1 Tax=Chroogloeocystis siderophila 5.2 s.c.1 TaxID=247279 RepID=A0A1U7I099_9CHRO|nr:DoxX family protein [Chroogloeocystis siderophila]OKH29287.1 DoxX family protein [Chroogloeocystis siderophila 5.2 s.c.1]